MEKKKLSIAIPASAISDTPHLREKTAKIGLIGRAAAIFRVDEIIIYPDDPKADQRRDLDFIALLLSYLETPQYLRKRLFKLEADLEFAGILPPLRTPHHPLSGKTKHLQIGEYREGVALSEAEEGLIMDIGVQQPALLRQKVFRVGDRLTLQVITTGKQIEVQVASREDVPVPGEVGCSSALAGKVTDGPRRSPANPSGIVEPEIVFQLGSPGQYNIAIHNREVV